MRILIVTPVIGGYPFLSALCQQLMSNGANEVHLACSSFGFTDTQLDEGIIHHTISMPRGANVIAHLRASRELRALIARLQPDLIEVHYSAAMLTTALARSKDRFIRTAVVHGLRFPCQTGFRRIIERTIELWAARRMDRVDVLSSDDLKALQEGGLAKTAGVAAPFGVGCDLQRFDPNRFSKTERRSQRASMCIEDDAIVVVYIGRFVDFKGFHIALRTFWKASEKSHRPLRFVLCGGFDSKHSSGLNRAELDRLETDDTIINMGWVDSTEKVLAVADLCLFPSRREGMPVCLMEALAMAVPVITTTARGCRDVVSHDSDGVLLDLTNPGRFTDALLDLTNDASKRKRFSRAAYVGRERFDRNRYVTHRLARFNEILKPKKQ